MKQINNMQSKFITFNDVILYVTLVNPITLILYVASKSYMYD